LVESESFFSYAQAAAVYFNRYGKPVAFYDWKAHGLSKLVKRGNLMVDVSSIIHPHHKHNFFQSASNLFYRNDVFLDTRYIIEASGEPVSKYRVKVFVPGRPEYILISGAPTYLGHRSLFLNQALGGW
jgi:hypothetical protein